MCQICEWGSIRVPYDIDVLLEKYIDALECAEDWTERNIYTEVIDDLRALKARQ